MPAGLLSVRTQARPYLIFEIAFWEMTTIDHGAKRRRKWRPCHAIFVAGAVEHSVRFQESESIRHFITKWKEHCHRRRHHH